MKVRESKELMKYVNEFFKYSIDEGFLNQNYAMENYTQIGDMYVEFNDSIDGDAWVHGNTVTINRRKTFADEKYASLVLFHELAHLCSDLHKNMFTPKGILSTYRDVMEREFSTDYKCGNRITKLDDVDNPYTYLMFGFLLLDEVTSENTAEQLVARKFNIQRKPYRQEQRKIGNHYVSYTTNMGYYTIGQGLADSFAKTLFLPNGEKNLNGLSKAVLNKGFTKDLIRQHYESKYALSALYKEISYLGAIAYYEEQSQGRLQERRKIDPQLVYESYQNVTELMDKGYEGREKIPNNIDMPDFYE